jgi:type IV pilus assembly protein PilQ
MLGGFAAVVVLTIALLVAFPRFGPPDGLVAREAKGAISDVVIADSGSNDDRASSLRIDDEEPLVRSPRRNGVPVRTVSRSQVETRPSKPNTLRPSRPIQKVDFGPIIDLDNGPVRSIAPKPIQPKTTAPASIDADAARRHVVFEPLASRTKVIDDSTSRLEARMVAMQRTIDQLAQNKKSTPSPTTDLDRATQLLQQIQQANQLQNIQQQLQQLKAGSAANPTVPAVPGIQPEAAPPTPASPSDPARFPSGNKPTVLKTQESDDGLERFSMQIPDVELSQVVAMLGEMSGENILVSDDVTGVVSANLQNVTIDEALDAILKSHDYVHQRDDKFIFVMSRIEAERRETAARKLITKIYRPNYVSVAELQTLVTPLFTPQVGNVAVTNPSEVGLPSDAEQAGGDRLTQRDALLVRDYDQVIVEIDKVFEELDVPPLQVVIEAMILSVRLTDSMEFGVNFALLNGREKGLFVSGNGNTLNQSSSFPGGSNNSLIPATGNFIADVAGMKYGFIQGDMTAFVEALETVADTNLIASLKVMVLNKQRAQLIIGQRISYITRTFQDNQTIESVNFLDAGTRLLIRPFISPDGLIRMEVHPERSSATINASTGLPDLETTEVTSNVMVRDGTTLVIGGLIEETTVESLDKLPLLGSIPGPLGKAFHNKSERIDRTELIVLITPRIVREMESTTEADALKYEDENRRKQFQERISPINRRNLVRIQRERAEHFLRKGDIKRAQHHIEDAMQHGKNDIETLRLRDRIEHSARQRRENWFRLPKVSATPKSGASTQSVARNRRKHPIRTASHVQRSKQ